MSVALSVRRVRRVKTVKLESCVGIPCRCKPTLNIMLAEVFFLFLTALASKDLVEACGPFAPETSHPFELTQNNRTVECNKKAYLVSSVVEEGARLALRECSRQFSHTIWSCSINTRQMQKEVAFFVNTTLPFATRETAFVQAIRSAAFVFEFTRLCTQNKLHGRNAEWIDQIEFGQKKARRVLHKIEKGSEAYKAVNLHNNKVGRRVFRAGASHMVRSTAQLHGNVLTLSLIPALFKVVGPVLKEKYHSATRVWFVNNTLQERVGHDQFKAISRNDNRLVYLNPSPDYCVRNDTLGSLGMLGRTCKSSSPQATKCRYFIAKCNSCKLKYKTVEYDMEEYKCKCRFHWCCKTTCKTCKRMSYITTCTDNAKA